ncbi:MAG: carbohydrate kinase [Deltaproteobacteria bacterium]|nr:carbohydrate kinase [Deltaproteobacteria bacterium]
MIATSDPRPAPDILIVGHVTRDLVRGEERLGGAAAFAARAAVIFGMRSALVTAAPEGMPLLKPLYDEPLIDIYLKPAPLPTTFTLDYSGKTRKIGLVARAPSLTPADIPVHLRQTPVAYVGPVAGECDAELISSLEAQHVIVGAQGWLRGAAQDGTVVPALTLDAVAPPHGIFALTLSELDHPDVESLAKSFAESIPVVAVTRGARGATLFAEGTTYEVPASPAIESDPTGAGDIFGLVLGLALHHGVPVFDAGRLASQAAARVVEGPGMGRLAVFAQSRDWRAVVGS